MSKFEEMWRNKILTNTEKYTSKELKDVIKQLSIEDEVLYSKVLIKALKEATIDEKIAKIFCKSACHMPHEKLERAKQAYEVRQSIEDARAVLAEDFKRDIKQYKNLTDRQVEDIIERGWGSAGMYKDGKIIATKIPSLFHEYFNEQDKTKQKYYYCHCPRIRRNLLKEADIDSIYCNCGGGFYEDIWHYITGKEIDIKVLKNLFDGDEVCQFSIKIHG